jgi:hypothetical protein
MRYILGILATLGLIILVLILLFRGGGNPSQTPKTLRLADYANSSDSGAHLLLGRPIIYNGLYEEVGIDVERDEVTFTLYRGFEGDIAKQSTYPNNESAYTSFLKGLQELGFTKGNTDEALQNVQGRCPNGSRNTYTFNDGSDELMHFWSTTCNTKTFEGSINGVTTMFRAQVPDYNSQIQGTHFSGSF